MNQFTQSTNEIGPQERLPKQPVSNLLEPEQTSAQRHRPYGFPQRLAIALSKRILRRSGNPPIKLVLPGGFEVAGSSQPIGAIRFQDYRTLVGFIADPLFQFGECYSNKTIEFQGDLAKCMTSIFRCMNRASSTSAFKRAMDQIRRPSRNSLTESKDNIHHHYDLGNDFYELWLDKHLLYSCAYFAREDWSLEQAQIEKMNHVCRKLRLSPGMQVIEAGCGWGALAMHLAENFGVRVKAFNISNEQIAYARKKAKERGIEDRVEFIQDDWRNIQGNYDAFVSVGMLEHVGIQNYEQLGTTINRILRPNGTGLIHSIGQNKSAPINTWIEKRIFPGAYPPTIKEMMTIFEVGDFQVLDVENLRLHYSLTLCHWLKRFEAVSKMVEEKFDDRFVRMWRMYLCGSIAAFDSGYLQLFQVVFGHGASNNVPRTREHIYLPANPVQFDLLLRQEGLTFANPKESHGDF